MNQFNGLNHNTLLTVMILIYCWSIFQALEIIQKWKQFSISEKIIKCITVAVTIVVGVWIQSMLRDIAI